MTTNEILDLIDEELKRKNIPLNYYLATHIYDKETEDIYLSVMTPTNEYREWVVNALLEGERLGANITINVCENKHFKEVFTIYEKVD